jgi:hypothetical protein
MDWRYRDLTECFALDSVRHQAEPEPEVMGSALFRRDIVARGRVGRNMAWELVVVSLRPHVSFADYQPFWSVDLISGEGRHCPGTGANSRHLLVNHSILSLLPNYSVPTTGSVHTGETNWTNSPEAAIQHILNEQ